MPKSFNWLRTQRRASTQHTDARRWRRSALWQRSQTYRSAPRPKVSAGVWQEVTALPQDDSLQDTATEGSSASETWRHRAICDLSRRPLGISQQDTLPIWLQGLPRVQWVASLDHQGVLHAGVCRHVMHVQTTCSCKWANQRRLRGCSCTTSVGVRSFIFSHQHEPPPPRDYCSDAEFWLKGILNPVTILYPQYQQQQQQQQQRKQQQHQQLTTDWWFYSTHMYLFSNIFQPIWDYRNLTKLFSTSKATITTNNNIAALWYLWISPNTPLFRSWRSSSPDAFTRTSCSNGCQFWKSKIIGPKKNGLDLEFEDTAHKST